MMFISDAKTDAWLFPHIFALKCGPGDTCFAVKTKCADCENEWNGHG